MMQEDQKEVFENHLREQIEILKKDILSYQELTKPVAPDSAIGRLTRMEAINSRSINEEALRKARAKLSKLERALKLIDDPDFGLCRACEEPIPFKRLMIMPESELCVQCAENISG
jgi:DnaK suppressor protein